MTIRQARVIVRHFVSPRNDFVVRQSFLFSFSFSRSDENDYDYENENDSIALLVAA